MLGLVINLHGDRLAGLGQELDIGKARAGDEQGVARLTRFIGGPRPDNVTAHPPS